jgi:hypothetical protein
VVDGACKEEEYSNILADIFQKQAWSINIGSCIALMFIIVRWIPEQQNIYCLLTIAVVDRSERVSHIKGKRNPITLGAKITLNVKKTTSKGTSRGGAKTSRVIATDETRFSLFSF